MQKQFTHIVNPYSLASGAPDRIQQTTFRALIHAAASTQHKVVLASAQFRKDRAVVPAGFVVTSDLTRSVRDVAPLPHAKELPLLADVLGKTAEIPDTEFVIYSNMDIIPVPGFYDGIAALLEKLKCDALIVNRRRVSADLADQPELLFLESGLPHPGYDCFVFRKELLSELTLKNCCLGAPGMGFLFAHNLFLYADKCCVVSDKHLTFHLGFDIVGEWSGAEVAKHQRSEIMKFLDENRGNFKINKFPGYNLPFFKRHFRWLMNPLFDYALMFRLDLKNLFDGRVIVHPEKKDSWWQEWKSSRINFD